MIPKVFVKNIRLQATIPGLHVYPITDVDNRATTTSSGAGVMVSVFLNSSPTSSVTVYPESSDPYESYIVLPPERLVFNNTNWNVPQTFMVYGQNSGSTQAYVDYDITMTIDTTDSQYASVVPPTIYLKNMIGYVPDCSTPGLYYLYFNPEVASHWYYGNYPYDHWVELGQYMGMNSCWDPVGQY